MRLAASQPWEQIELTEIAAEAGLTLSQLRGLFPSKLAMLGGLTRMVDDAVLAGSVDDLMGEPFKESCSISSCAASMRWPPTRPACARSPR